MEQKKTNIIHQETPDSPIEREGVSENAFAIFLIFTVLPRNMI